MLISIPHQVRAIGFELLVLLQMEKITMYSATELQSLIYATSPFLLET